MDIVDRLSFDAARCEATFSKGVATNIEEAIAEIKRLRAGVTDIDDAITAYSRSIGKSRESLVIQQHNPAWVAWKKLCDTLATNSAAVANA